MTSASSRFPAMTATWKEEIVKDCGSGSKEDGKDQNDHTSEGCGRRSTAAARNSVRHRWSFVDRDPRTRSYATHRGGHPVNHCVKWQRAYTGRAHDGMSPGYKAVAKFTKTLLIDAASRSCGRRLRTACAADFCGAGNPPLCAEKHKLNLPAAIISLSSWAPNLHNDDENQHCCDQAATGVEFEDQKTWTSLFSSSSSSPGRISGPL